MTVNFEIKPLNEQEYSAAPEAVRKVYISVLENIPLSTAVLKATIKAHPEYFRLKQDPDEQMMSGRGTGKTFGDKQAAEKPKTFGQNVKRLFALKDAMVLKKKKRPGKNPFPWGRNGTTLDPLPLDFLGKVTDMRFVKKEDVEFPPSCNGNCGMNYCDDNGCIDRKRELVDPEGDIGKSAFLNDKTPNPNG